MDTGKLVETQMVSKEHKSTDSTHTVKLVEMDKVSVATKGILQGLELHLTPRSF